MIIAVGDDVFVKTKQCTGEVRDQSSDEIFSIHRDYDRSLAEHHISDLIKFPLKKKKINYIGFYLVVTAEIKNGNRTPEMKCYRDDGRRLW